MKKKNYLFILIFLFSLTTFFMSCEKDEEVIGTLTILHAEAQGDTLLLYFKAYNEGHFSMSGLVNVDNVSVVIDGHSTLYSKNIDVDFEFVNWTRVAKFAIEDLECDKSYHIREVCATAGYSSIVSECLLPFKKEFKVSKIEASNLTATKCTMKAKVNGKGKRFSSCGFCYSDSNKQLPTVANDVVKAEKQANSLEFSANLDNLQPQTTYYIRAFVQTEYGDYLYGDATEVTTKEFSLKTYCSYNYLGDVIYSVTCKGILNEDVDSSFVESYGFCYSSRMKLPVKEDSHTDFIEKKGFAKKFTEDLTDLAPKTKYYVRAYVSTKDNTFYGDVQEVSKDGASVYAEYKSGTATSLEFAGSISNIDSSFVKSYGFCYSATNETPTKEDAFTETKESASKFSETLDGLTPDTKYYVRAYVTTKYGTHYGDVKTATTRNVSVSTSYFYGSDISVTTLKCSGYISNIDSSFVESYGFCYSTTNETPTKDDAFTETKESASKFSETLDGLTPDTKYYVRAYVTTKYGTHYGDVETATTSSVSVSTSYFYSSDISVTTLKCSGNISNIDSSFVESYGFCYSTTNETPTKEDAFTETKESVSKFSETLKGLTPDTKYYVRAYVTTKYGTHYGDVKTATTRNVSVSTSYFYSSDISATTLKCSGNISNIDSSLVGSYGFCYSTTNETPTKEDAFTETKESVSEFSETLKSLTPNTKYYVRAYVTTKYGIHYGDVETATTKCIVTTVNSSHDNTITRIYASGYIDNAYVSAVESYGFCYSKTNNEPDKNDLFTETSGVKQTFSEYIINLEPDTKYYIRAYVIIDGTIFYGNTLETTTESFTTSVSVKSATSVLAFTYNFLSNTDWNSYGLCYSATNKVPTKNDLFVEGSSSYNESLTIDNLTPSTIYYMRAYIERGGRIFYGDVKEVKTKDPVDISLNSSSLTATSATCIGTVNIRPIDSYGFCYSETNTMPNISDSTIENQGNISTYAEELTDLKSGTLYYVRAYVKVGEQVYYGGVITVRTLQ